MSFSVNKFGLQVLGLREQAARIRMVCPNFNYHVRGGELVGHASMQPAPHCESYSFQLRYRVGQNPKIVILEPRLRLRDDQDRIPHTYGENEPCLFRPGVDWSKEDSIATTVIPWLATWLFYYEVWHATGEWYGGGEHPPRDDDEQPTETIDQSEK